MSDATPEFPIALIGTSSFVPLLLTYVRNSSAGLPIEPVIFQSILLCLIAGKKHLVLRTAEDDVGLVVKLAVKTLATVFGVLTHRLRIHRRGSLGTPDATPNVSAFLRSLFVPSPAPTSPSPHPTPDEASTIVGHGPRRYRNKRPSSRSRSRTATVRSKASQYTKSVSYPSDLISNKSSYTAPSVSLSASDPFGDYHAPSVTGTLSPNPLNSPSRNSSLSTMQPAFPHSYSDPTPLRALRDSTQMQLPDALVVSGLENASLPSQRALTTVLTEGKVVLEEAGPFDHHAIESRGKGQRLSRSTLDMDTDVGGVWTLPKDFLLVYVCPSDERERPALHKSLLEKFSMSATVSLHHTIRAHSATFFRSPSYRSSPILSPVPQLASYPPNSTPPFLTQSLPQRHLSPGIMTPSNGSHAVITPEIMRPLREVFSKVHVPSSLNLYLSDLFSAARHHHQLEGRLLSATSINDALQLSRAARVLGGDLTGMELINDFLLQDGGERVDVRSTSSGDDRIAEAMHDIDSAYVVIDHHADTETRVSVEEGTEEITLPVLDVTQADIARIVPRVLSHRLRVRDDPEDEVLSSAVFGAASSAAGKYERGRKEREQSRATVKELLIGILQEV